MTLPKKSSVQYTQDVEGAKEYYASLNREGFSNITNERFTEIVNIAKLYFESKKTLYYDLTIQYKFCEIINKLKTSKNNTFACGKILANSYESCITFENDDEKILLILAFCDPENILLKTWLTTKQRLLKDDEKNFLSAANYLKAKKIMQMYFDGFFDIKLITDEERLLNRITELEAQHEINNRVEKIYINL